MKKEKAFIVNMIGSLLTFLVSFGINFFFTPYITETIGGEAYGFVGLANNMVNYITIITVALNSVAGRFITVSYHKGQKQEANQYFSSVFLSNVVMAAVISVVAIPVIIKLDFFFEIPLALVVSVKQLFAFIYMNFILTLLSTVYTTATFITNKLYLSSIANIVTALLKVIVLCILFGMLTPNVAYIGIATCVSTLAGLILNVIYTRRLIPEIHVRRADVSGKKVWELITSGIWSSVTKLSQVLSDGLDLLITNIWISAYFMGQLSIAQTIPTYMASLLNMIISLFNPNLTLQYAKDNVQEMVTELKTSMKLTGFFSNIIFAFMFVFGDYFFKLWVPNQDYQLIYRLSLIIMMSVLVSGVTTSLNNVFLITNKLKINSLFWLGVSILNVSLVAICLNVTSLGIYAVAGISKFTGAIGNFVYLPLYASKCLKVKWNTFYPLILKYMGTTAAMVFAFYLLRLCVMEPNNWFLFLVLCAISGMIGLGMNYFILLEKKERAILTKRILRR